jgi:hypothetical protein
MVVWNTHSKQSNPTIRAHTTHGLRLSEDGSLVVLESSRMRKRENQKEERGRVVVREFGAVVEADDLQISGSNLFKLRKSGEKRSPHPLSSEEEVVGEQSFELEMCVFSKRRKFFVVELNGVAVTRVWDCASFQSNPSMSVSCTHRLRRENNHVVLELVTTTNQNNQLDSSVRTITTYEH